MSDLATAKNEGRSKRPSLRKPFTRFSLRALFLLTTLAAIGTVVYQRRVKINSVVEHLEGLGAKVEYHWDPVSGMSFVFGDFFKDARAIDLKRTKVKDDDLTRIGNLRRLERLYLPGTEITSEGIGHLATNVQLQRLSLWGCPKIFDSAFTELRKIKNLQVLDIHNTNVTGKGLERVAELPTLRHLKFSVNFNKSETDLMTTKQIKILGDLAKRGLRASPVGKAHIGNVNDQSLQTLMSLDTARMKAIWIFNSHLTSAGMKCIADLDPHSAHFEDCSLNANAIDCLADVEWGRCYYCFHRVNLTPTELAARIGKRCIRLEISSRWFRFELDKRNGSSPSITYPNPSIGGLMVKRQPDDISPGEQISPDLIRALTELKSLKCEHKFCAATVAAVHEVQPNIHLELYGPQGLDERFWQAIEETPTLTGLTIYGPPAGQPRFTADHQIEWFTYELYAGGRTIAADQSLFDEVAKLSKLKFLRIQNENPIGDQIAPLVQLNDLKTVRVYHVGDEAVRHVLKMKLNHFDMDQTTLISTEGLDQLRRAPLNVRWNGNNLLRIRK